MKTFLKLISLSILGLFAATGMSGCSMSDIIPSWNDPAYFGDGADLGKEMGGSGTGYETWKFDW